MMHDYLLCQAHDDFISSGREQKRQIEKEKKKDYSFEC